MDDLLSPDWPAPICYLVVLGVGMLSARAAVNRLLDSASGRWSFTDTWMLFWAQTAVPVALFWLLDHTKVIHDTSLFAALLIALAYQQVLEGGVQNIAAPSATSRLWQPFDKWRSVVTERIARSLKHRLDTFDSRVARHVAALPRAAGIDRLENVALERSPDPAELQAQLQGLPRQPSPALDLLVRARLLVRHLRSLDVENYSALLGRAKLVPPRTWLTPARQSILGAGLGYVMLLLLPLLFVVTIADKGEIWIEPYLRWRLTKEHATARDRHRIAQHLRSLSHQANADTLQRVLSGATRELDFAETSPAVTEAILALARDASPAQLRDYWLRELSGSLATCASGNRVLIHRTLVHLASRAFPGRQLPPELQKWEKLNEEGAIPGDELRHAWLRWIAPEASSGST